VSKSVTANATPPTSAYLHPLLHQNTSDLIAQRYSSVFTGQEFFIADHQVQGRKLLPGVAYLEMARAAAEQATGYLRHSAHEPMRVRLQNIAWTQPLIVDDGAKTVHIAVHAEQDGQIHYEIYTEADDVQQAPVVHSQGAVSFIPDDQGITLNLPELQATISEQRFDGAQCYAAFAAMGIVYGPGHQGIETVYVENRQVLAKLALPDAVAATLEHHVLHPGLLDSALQALIGLVMIEAEAGSPESALKPVVPFALEELTILDACKASMWAWIRYAENGAAANAKLHKMDIDLCDESGKVCVQLKGFSSRELAVDDTVGTLMCVPVWKNAAAIDDNIDAYHIRHLVILCGLDQLIDHLVDAPGVHYSRLHAEETQPDARYQTVAVQLFEIIRDILENKPKFTTLVQVLIAADEAHWFYRGLSGLLKTAHLENPKILGQMIEVEPTETQDALLAKISENSRSLQDTEIRYRHGLRQVLAWEDMPVAGGTAALPWKDGGVYLITGGAGGLGLIFAAEIASKTRKATLILTGRSELDAGRHSRVKALESLGARVEYRRVDVSRQDEVEALVQWIKTDVGRLDGILHSAGVTRDNFMFRKSVTEFREVLAPKVSGAVNLDQATLDFDLDFCIFFSSLAGVAGNPGQADYATANAFIDAYADYRQQRVLSKQRRGLTLSINWPLWQEGGMQIDEPTAEIIRQRTGLVAIETQQGIDALVQAVCSKHSRVMVLSGDTKRLKADLARPFSAPQVEPSAKAGEVLEDIAQDGFEEKVQHYFKKRVSEALDLPVHRIQAEEALESYGINSIMVMSVTNELEKDFGSLSKTLFFEYQTIRDLTHYFIEAHGVRLREILSVGATLTPADLRREAPTLAAQALKITSRTRFAFLPLSSPTVGALDIAIVGLSGRYPKSRDLDAYWDNLCGGRDCITEVPRERWDWRDFYSEDRSVWGAHFSNCGGFIDGVTEFDPLFFNMSPREAELIDPQERLFLEQAWMAVEDAGYCRRTTEDGGAKYLALQTGVYVAVMYGEYPLFAAEASLSGDPMVAGGSFASIANRVSYILNLHGPSMAVDTMCSGSLTSLHLACQDLKLGRTDMAIAGGVNISIHPNKYRMLSAGQFISSRGRCESFGAEGEGYIPGEGVGAVLLKRLADAERDGDRIYGVIKGSAVNHGGKTNGYSVPNPNAQQIVIAKALEEARIDPRAVSYIEAHGTGTQLGDPIEITGLTKAFRVNRNTQDGQDSPYCWIGSVKSNIGHAESAAGIAGVTKVLLQMQHGQIAPSLHAGQLNPHIDFAATPFIVNRQLRDWEPPVVDGKLMPRIAGVSSFGAGGSNAHLVIEEYVHKRPAAATAAPQPVLLVLSARDDERLQAYAAKLLAFVQAKFARGDDVQLPDLAYSLQVGREAMEERLGLVVSSIEELCGQLQRFLADSRGGADIYRGSAKRDNASLAVLAADEDMAKTLDVWISKRKYSKLLELWVKGLNLDWDKLYADKKPSRIRVPTYPFAGEHYWLPLAPVGGTALRQDDALHPLVHKNISTFGQQGFSSVFSGHEFFLRDHEVQGRKILPGVAYFEMARAAAVLSAGNPDANGLGVQLENLVWAQPVVIGNAAQAVNIALTVHDDGQIRYEIYTGADQDRLVHSRGAACLAQAGKRPVLDIAALRQQTNLQVFDGTQCYAAFAGMGIHYGPGHQALSTVYAGNSQVLAKLALPDCVADTETQYVLHPSLMDGALQASIGFVLGVAADSESAGRQAALPFALEGLEIFASCTASMWAWIRFSEGSLPGDKVQKLDIDVADEAGCVCVSMKGFSLRSADEQPPAPDKSGYLLFSAEWRQCPVATDSITIKKPAREYSLRQLIVIESQTLADQLSAIDEHLHKLVLSSNAQTADGRFADYAASVFAGIKALLQQKPKTGVLVQLIVFGQHESSLWTALSALLKTARLENLHLIAQLIDIEPHLSIDEIRNCLQVAEQHAEDSEMRFRQGRCELPGWQAVPPEEISIVPWQDRGVYLITGGLGGLGLVFAAEIVRHTRGAKLVLVGRSKISAANQAVLDGLRRNGAEVGYRPVDITQRQQVEALMQAIRLEYGGLHGIIHSAGVIQDNFIINKSEQEFL
ncbi:MAG: SDR family NAD(P)-dependent oxidoreductase, partial [Methylovulum sp.]